jgi:hypothetical protein
MCADRFYVLRNHIIHGEKLKDRDFVFLGQYHYHLGLWFFLVSVKKMINESFGDKIFYDTIKYKEGCFVYENGNIIRAIERAFNKVGFCED